MLRVVCPPCVTPLGKVTCTGLVELAVSVGVTVTDVLDAGVFGWPQVDGDRSCGCVRPGYITSCPLDVVSKVMESDGTVAPEPTSAWPVLVL
jgi:hypothetical protein